MDDHDLPGAPSSNFAIAGVLTLAFGLGGCGDNTGFYDDGGYDDGYLDTGPLDTGPITTTPFPDTGPNTTYDDGWDEGWDEGYYYTDSGPFPTTDPTTGPSTATWTTTGIDTTTTDDTASSTTGTTAPDTETAGTTETTGDASTTGTDSSSGTDSSGGSTGDTDGGGDVEFPPLGVFGDDVTEVDLVGTWSLQWEPDGTTWDSVLEIDMSGNFIWRETSADCSVDTLATGVLWVEPGQIVMHVDTWERALPWDTLGIAGQDFPAPFRLRMSYGLLGPNLGLTAPDGITETEPFTGRAYLQDAFDGKFIGGTYVGEAELLAAFQGDLTPTVIVRDRWTAKLDAEPDIVPESTGIVWRDQIYWGLDPPVATPQIFESGNWTCLDGCTLPNGATLINGGNLYAYGAYGGYQRMMTFASGRSFKRDVDTDCP